MPLSAHNPQLLTKSEADIFSTKPYQSTIETSFYTDYRPKTSGYNQVIIFEIPPSPNYIDLSLTRIKIKCQILNPDGKPVKNAMKTDKVTRDGVWCAPENNFLGTLFKDISVSINHKQVTPKGSFYPYRSYLEKLLNYSKESKDTHLSSSLYIENEVGKFDDIDNAGCKKRMNRMSDDGVLHLTGYLHTELSNVNKLILSNLELNIQFNVNDPRFCLLTDTNVESSKQYKIDIQDAILQVRKVKLNESMLYANDIFLKSTNAKYCVERVEMKSKPIKSGESSFIWENCFLAQLPKRIFLFMAEQDAEFNYRKSPYRFQPFSVSYISLTGDLFPHLKPIELDIEKKNYMDAYLSLYDSLNTYFHDTSIAITPESYLSDNFIVAFDLTDDMSSSANYQSMPKSGVLRLELKFAKPLTTNINLMLYAELENSISIDGDRVVYNDFPI